MIRTFQDEYGVQVIHAWGMTEMSPLGTVGTLKEKQAGLDKEARVAPSSILSAKPSPRSGKAPQKTPSAPVLTNTRSPKRRMTSVQKRPVPATICGATAQALRMRSQARPRSGDSPCPVPKRAKAIAT